MATWNTRGLRGSTLEELINRTNELYLEKGLALIESLDGYEAVFITTDGEVRLTSGADLEPAA